MEFLDKNQRKYNNIYYELNFELSIILFDRSVDIYDLNDFDKFMWAFLVINGLLDKKEFIKPNSTLSMFGELLKTFNLENQKMQVRSFIVLIRSRYLTKRDRDIDDCIY